jgi:predicted house-cleaning noncanonical NTP pyrophosphatase (MazG superfamily)
MAKRHYRKLVRDKIPDIIEGAGKECKWHRATDRTYKKFLAKKLYEEAKEFRDDPSAEELADVMEVLRYIIRDMDLKPYEAMNKKGSEKGRFDHRIILDWVEE